MSYQLPDATTPWHSNDEMSAAMLERDHLGRKRYENDEAFRLAVEAKCNLGTLHGEVPVDSGRRGTIRVESGRAEQFGKHYQYDATEEERAMMQHSAALTSEIASLDAEEQQNTVNQGLFLRERVNLDPSQPVKPFATKAEMTAAIASYDYRTYPHIRAYVEACTEVSDFSE